MKHCLLDYDKCGKVIALSVFAKTMLDLDLCVKATLIANCGGKMKLLGECYSTQVSNVEPSKFN